MPVLDEEGYLERTLSLLRLTPDEELIVVDGGSTDNTTALARACTEKVFITSAGRSRQMNLGAKEAMGEILLFLHADCVLPSDAFGMVRQALEDESVSAGAFDLRIDHPSLLFRLIEFGANLRSRLTRMPYGDQAIFLGKDTFERAGGFSDIPLMEDVDLSNRLKRMGKIVFLGRSVLASPRRWLREGAIYTTLRDWALVVAYSVFNVRPERLARYYGNVR